MKEPFRGRKKLSAGSNFIGRKEQSLISLVPNCFSGIRKSTKIKANE